MRKSGTFPDLIKGNVDIWFSEVDRPTSEIKEFEVLLSSEELSRARRFHFLRDRNRYVVQHGILRVLLARYTGCKPCEIAICTGSSGKPYLPSQKNGSEIHFSVSRSEAFAAFAFSWVGSIGIDIEKIHDIPDMLEIVERNFTTNEKIEILAFHKTLRTECFYKFWTRKEAILKAQGDGLLIPLDRVNVSPIVDSHEPCRVKILWKSVEEEFRFTDIVGPAGFMVAFASSAPYAEILTRLHEKNYFESGLSCGR